jgi:hypothetical protein
MICGTLIIEDFAINFQHRDDIDDGNPNPHVVYTVSGHMCEQETVTCSVAAWEAAMVLLQMGSELRFGITSEIYQNIELVAQSALPISPNLRWIP